MARLVARKNAARLHILTDERRTNGSAYRNHWEAITACGITIRGEYRTYWQVDNPTCSACMKVAPQL